MKTPHRFTLSLAAVVLAFGVFACAKSSQKETPVSFVVPKELVGTWIRGLPVTLSSTLLRIHEDGKIERLAPQLDKPSVLGRFNALNTVAGKKELRLQVEAGVTNKEVISLPFAYDLLSNNEANFHFITDFFRLETTIPVGPGAGGFWGPGAGISLPVDLLGDTQIEKDIFRTVKRLPEGEVAKTLESFVQAEAKEKVAKAAFQKRLKLRSLVKQTLLKHLEGGTWVLEKVELRSRKGGFLVVEDVRNPEWAKTGHSAALHEESTLPEDFSVTWNGKEWLARANSGETKLPPDQLERIFHGYLHVVETPVRIEKDLVVSLHTNLWRDYERFFSLFYFRRVADPSKATTSARLTLAPQKIPVPKEKKTDAEKIEVMKNFVHTQLLGTWHLQRVDLLARNGTWNGGTRFDPNSEGQTKFLVRKVMPTLEFTADRKVKAGDKQGAYESFHTADFDIFIRSEQVLGADFTFFGRSGNTLQLSLGITTGESVVLSYGPNPVKPETFAVEALRSSFYAALYDSSASFDGESRRQQLDKAMLGWSKAPNRELELPLWIALRLGVDLNRRQLRFRDAEALIPSFDFLEARDQAELTWWIEQAIQ